jgi:nanoRNase/pAp phosphatase (c-di-AMP/oligoRNAs hydrolase)
MRGRGHDVSAVCGKFGGGGHAGAAGCTLTGMDGHAALTAIIQALEEELDA